MQQEGFLECAFQRVDELLVLASTERGDNQSLCLAAGEQGKFWEMHDLIFASPRQLAPETMRKHAETLGLDLAKYDAAFKSEGVAKKIEADQAEGRKALVLISQGVAKPWI